MPEYIAEVTAHSTRSMTVWVTADTQREAQDKAFDIAFGGEGEWENEETTAHSIELTEIEVV